MIDVAGTMAKSAAVSGLLRRRGLPSSIGEAIAMLAGTIRDHKHLEQLLTSCSGEERTMLYESVRPHLRFVAKPLDVYISHVAEKAEREQWPVMVDGKLTEFKSAQDVATTQKGIANVLKQKTLKLVCFRCTKWEEFPQIGNETAVDVSIKARKVGWVYNVTTHTETCPKCAELYA